MTPKQRRFVDAIISGKGKRAAAIAAGFKPNSAHVSASRMLSDAKVQAALQKFNAQADALTVLTAAHIKQKLIDTAQEARDAGQYGAAVSGYGKLLDKVEPDLIEARQFIAEVPSVALSEKDWATSHNPLPS